MKKMLLILAPLSLALSACVAPTGTTGTAGTPTMTEQLGVVAFKIAVNAKCTTQLSNLPAWKAASQAMTAEQQQTVQSNICGCVSDKALTSVTAVDLATAAIDPAARTTIVNNAVSRTINTCVAEAVK